jgi:hypothetical protein
MPEHKIIASSVPFFGVYRMRQDTPGFGICLFHLDDGQVLAACEDADEVIHFQPVNIEGSIICPVPPSHEDYRCSTGDRLLYAYQRADLTIACGPREDVEAAVRADLHNIREVAPFLWEEAANFIHDSSEHEAARAVTAKLLKR